MYSAEKHAAILVAEWELIAVSSLVIASWCVIFAPYQCESFRSLSRGGVGHHQFLGSWLFARCRTKCSPMSLNKCWADVVRTGVAVGVAAGIVWMLRTLVAEPTTAEALLGIYPVCGIWFVIDILWAMSYTFWPRTHRRDQRGVTTSRPMASPDSNRRCASATSSIAKVAATWGLTMPSVSNCEA